MCAINVLLAIGLDFILGYAGQLNLGHSAFYGLGAYVSTLLIVKLGIPFWVAFVAGVAFAGVAGMISLAVRGAPARPLSGDRLARLRGHRPSDPAELDQPDAGAARHLRAFRRRRRSSIAGTSVIDFRNLAAFFYLVAGFALLTYLHPRPAGALADRRNADRDPRGRGVRRLARHQRARPGRSSHSASAPRSRGAAGCFYASFVGTLVPDAFFITEAFTILAMVIVGGMGTLIGPVLGAILLDAAARSAARLRRPAPGRLRRGAHFRRAVHAWRARAGGARHRARSSVCGASA